MTITRHPTTVAAQPGTPFLDVERVFDATPAQLFRAQSEPELVRNWLGPRGYDMLIEEYDVRPGGRYRYIHRNPAGAEFGFRGVFHTVTPGKAIIQTFEYDGMPGLVSLDTSTYEDLGGRTRLRTHTVFPTVQARDGALASGMEGGIVDSMERLEELLAASA